MSPLHMANLRLLPLIVFSLQYILSEAHSSLGATSSKTSSKSISVLSSERSHVSSFISLAMTQTSGTQSSNSNDFYKDATTKKATGATAASTAALYTNTTLSLSNLTLNENERVRGGPYGIEIAPIKGSTTTLSPITGTISFTYPTSNGPNYHVGDAIAKIPLAVDQELEKLISTTACVVSPKRSLENNLASCMSNLAQSTLQKMDTGGPYNSWLNLFPLDMKLPPLAPLLGQYLPEIIAAGQKVPVFDNDPDKLNDVAETLILILYAEGATKGRVPTTTIVIPSDEISPTITAPTTTTGTPAFCPPLSIAPCATNCGGNIAKDPQVDCTCGGIVGAGNKNLWHNGLWRNCKCIHVLPQPADTSAAQYFSSALNAFNEMGPMATKSVAPLPASDLPAPPIPVSSTLPLATTTSIAPPLATGSGAHSVPADWNGDFTFFINQRIRTTSTTNAETWSLYLEGRTSSSIASGSASSTFFTIPVTPGTLLVHWSGDPADLMTFAFTDQANVIWDWDENTKGTKFFCTVISTSSLDGTKSLSCSIRTRPSADDNKYRIDLDLGFYPIAPPSGKTLIRTDLIWTLYTATLNEIISSNSLIQVNPSPRITATASGYPQPSPLGMLVLNGGNTKALIQFSYGPAKWYSNNYKESSSVLWCDKAGQQTWLPYRVAGGKHTVFSCWYYVSP